ncbi:hypothetical protein CC1G_00558 [Coprinopsis cinerea okayama7|uniref:Uncharacterized protein n=1 Tax=Coprinopsis cinerea (strain Okayama-7 / 130 / ATCC MYA-4618 / FGSC 9003) TaxID=240176 RepID=A8N3D4_COPC7|nr:hypothetical protein CC1G_00558 [Coprinopsis cinerea okayama7\|eukprot:XP_001829379.1 hypothetical protein CC1G_00558 [Coprinopsis cinerea okayama7\
MTSPEGNELTAAIEQLKLEGNELYKKNQYEKASLKYTEAIEKDPTNHILLANRAAAYLATNQYVDAAWDCQQAIALDPSYAKAWSRLAAAAHALELWEHCIEAWQKALECLPSDESAMTPADKAVKVQFEEGLKKAKSASRSKGSSSRMGVEKTARKLPWTVAKSLIETGQLDNSSSAWVIGSAYQEYKQGLDMINSSRFENGMFYGKPDALMNLCNGILCDERVFHLDNRDFPAKLTSQCRFENVACKGWAEEGGPDLVKKEAVERLAKDGWNATRPAIAVTLRTWIFTAYFRSELAGHRHAAHELYLNALNVLQWGREQWPDVPKNERGAVFERSFIRGVKRLKMLNMHKTLVGGVPANPPYTEEDLAEVARDLIQDVDSDPVPTWAEDIPGHFSASWPYTKASALSILGWYHMFKASESEEENERIDHNRQAADHYQEAADLYSLDDENHPYFLCTALDCLNKVNAPLNEIVPLCKDIRDAIPQALAIWQVSSAAAALPLIKKEITEFEFKVIMGLVKGELTMDSVVKMDPIAPAKMSEGGKSAGNSKDTKEAK